MNGEASPVGPNFRSERRESIISSTVRRPSSIMDGNVPPSVLGPDIGDPIVAPGGPPASRSRARTNSTVQGSQDIEIHENQNTRAVQVLVRVKEKLTGHDFKPDEELPYIQQVDKLLIEATKLENLCQHYIGWCSFW